MTVQHLAHPKRKWLYDKRLLRFRPGRGCEPQAEQPIHCSLERIAGPVDFVFNQPDKIVLERECCSHIMMLSIKAS